MLKHQHDDVSLHACVLTTLGHLLYNPLPPLRSASLILNLHFPPLPPLRSPSLILNLHSPLSPLAPNFGRASIPPPPTTPLHVPWDSEPTLSLYSGFGRCPYTSWEGVASSSTACTAAAAVPLAFLSAAAGAACINTRKLLLIGFGNSESSRSKLAFRASEIVDRP